MMKMNPHLNFHGNCAGASRFCEPHLGANPLFSLTYRASPEGAKFRAECADKIMHAPIQVGDVVVRGCDTPPGYYQPPNGFCVSLSLDDPAEAERVFNALA